MENKDAVRVQEKGEILRGYEGDIWWNCNVIDTAMVRNINGTERLSYLLQQKN